MRPLRLLLAILLCAWLAPGSARAQVGIGLQAGAYTPTKSARDLIDAQWQLGGRLLLPPYSPVGVLPVRRLSLDLGLDVAFQKARQLTVADLKTQLLNVTAVYRYTIPVGEKLWVYGGLGGRLSAVWGELSQQLRDGSLFGHLRGALSLVGGADLIVADGTLVDLRLAGGVLGFTAWEANLGVLFAM